MVTIWYLGSNLKLEFNIMKAYILLLIFCAMGSFFIGCGTTSSITEPPQKQHTLFRGANTIYVETGDSPLDAYRNVARILRQNGYMFESTDDVLYYLDTNVLWADRGVINTSAYVDVYVDNGKTVIQMTGEYSTIGRPNSFDEIENTGFRATPSGKAWYHLFGMAKSYPNITDIKFGKIEIDN